MPGMWSAINRDLSRPLTREQVLLGVRGALNVLILLLAMIGLAGLLDVGLGDGPLPRFRTLSDTAPALIPELGKNATSEVGRISAAQRRQLGHEAIWEKMRPTRRILQAISPEIGDWLEEMASAHRLEYDSWFLQNPIAPGLVYLAADKNRNVLKVGPAFWFLSDGHKAAFIVHEYRHFRQNRPKVIANLAAKLLTGRLPEYGSLLEDEAHLYQLAAYRALGLPYNTIIRYLHYRNLLNYDPLLDQQAGR